MVGVGSLKNLIRDVRILKMDSIFVAQWNILRIVTYVPPPPFAVKVPLVGCKLSRRL